MSAPIPVILLGLGPIGRAIGQAVAAEGRLEVVGAVDIDPVIVGKPLHHVCDADLPPLLVVSDLADTHAPPGAVVLQATGSRLETVRPQLLQAIALGYHVVSTCEELVWPWDDHPDGAGELNRACRQAQVAVLGVGVNPGFVMDTLPVLVARAAGEVEAVHVIRVVDVAQRRLSLQRKMGVGEDPAVVQSLLDQERIGHVGLSNSLQMLAAGLGWTLDMIDIDSRPIIAKDTVMTASGPIEAGRCLGIRQQATGMVQGRPRLFLRLVMEAGVATGSYDEIIIDGAQSLRLRLEGLQGDQATAWLVVNQALLVRRLPPGLHTMLSAPLLPML
jgi:4-hydroxy-tetrahydrodipicolinate reductase